MQRDFCQPDGAFDRLGVDISMYPPLIPRVAALLDGARRAGVLVIFIQMTVLPGRLSDSPAQMRFNLRLHLQTNGGEPLRYAADGSEGQEILPELAPREGELVVKKYRSSAFWGRNAKMFLRANGMGPPAAT